jgi:hypothetical protein
MMTICDRIFENEGFSAVARVVLGLGGEYLATGGESFDDLRVMLSFDRRVRRTTEPKRALAMFLSSCRQRNGADVIAVSTLTGRLVAGAGDGALLVAVLAARVAAGGERHESLAVARCGGYVIASMGRAVSDDVADGVRRILS